MKTLKPDNNMIDLIERGLSDEEAKIFLGLLRKISLTKKDYEAFDSVMENDIPFEGGMSFTEALTGLKISIE